MTGRDIAGYKRELHFAGEHNPAFVWLHNPSFGAGMADAVRAFQRHHKLVVDGQVGPITHAHLWPFGDAFAHWLIAHQAPATTGGPRIRLVAEMRYLISQHENILYDQIRPIPLKAILQHRWPVRTDCSGLYTAACYAAGLADPNGFHYNGAGNTETLLAHLPRRAGLWQVRPGDAAIFGINPSHHVVGFLEDGRTGDPEVFSHGHAGNPDDPASYPLSAFLDYFRGIPVTYLNCIS